MSAPPRERRPNILFILADDMGAWAMGCAGNPEIRTPNLDRLAATGIRFDSMFCASPVCSAARASILTGTIPSGHGVHDFLLWEGRTYDHTEEFLKGQTGYTDLLAKSGYTCGHAGKWHIGTMAYAQKSYAFWRPKYGGYRHCAFFDETGHVADVPGYGTDCITDFAIEFLEQQRGGGAPFYLNVAYDAPHSPWGRADHPAEVWDDFFGNCPFESCPYPPIHPWDAGLTDFFAHPEIRRSKLAGYFTAITCMDAAIGRLLDWLEAHGMRENTLVVFTSDNGMNMGHHGICGKGNGTRPLNMFDTSVKVPGLASMPGTIQQGAVSDALVSHYDLFPTFLEVGGVADPDADAKPGSSFAPLLRGQAREREPLVVFDEYGYTRMIRDGRWKYVHRHPRGPHELYDLATDPGELRNLAENHNQQARVTDLEDQLQTWFARFVDPPLDGTRLAVAGCGQRDLATAPDAFAQQYPAEWIAARNRNIQRYESGTSER